MHQLLNLSLILALPVNAAQSSSSREKFKFRFWRVRSELQGKRKNRNVESIVELLVVIFEEKIEKSRKGLAQKRVTLLSSRCKNMLSDCINSVFLSFCAVKLPHSNLVLD